MKFSSAFFAKNLKNWREFLNESQTEFAERFRSLDGSSAKRAIISSYEVDRATPKLEFLFEFAQMTKASLDTIFSIEIDYDKPPDMLNDPIPTADYKPTPSDLRAFSEKLDALWALNLHRAEKMEAWEVEMKAMRAELDRANAELVKLKASK